MENMKKENVTYHLFFLMLMGGHTLILATELSPYGQCQNLRPVKNLDDIIQQFYENLNSGCLVDMSATALEKKWKLPIYQESTLTSYSDPKWLSRQSRPYHHPTDAFSVSKFDNLITLEITDAYREKYGTLFRNDFFPSYLPTPIREDGGGFISSFICTPFSPTIIPEYKESLNKYPKTGIDDERKVVYVRGRIVIKQGDNRITFYSNRTPCWNDITVIVYAVPPNQIPLLKQHNKGD